MISRIGYYWKKDIKKSYVLLIRFYESSQKLYANLWDAWYWLLKIGSRWKNPINCHKNCQNATTFRASASNVDKFFTRPLNCLLLVGSFVSRARKWPRPKWKTSMVFFSASYDTTWEIARLEWKRIEVEGQLIDTQWNCEFRIRSVKNSILL